MHRLRLGLAYGRRVGCGERGSASHKTDSRRNQKNSCPTGESDVFMQNEFRHEGEQNVADRSRGKNIGKVSPRQCGCVGSEEAEEQHDAQEHPRIAQCDDQLREARERNVADVLHPTREGKVPAGGKHHHPCEDQVLTPAHDRV